VRVLFVLVVAAGPLILIPLSLGYVRARQLMATLLWGFLVSQLIAFPSALAAGGARTVVATILCATTAQGAIAAHSEAMEAFRKYAEASRRRRFPEGVEWALLACLPAIFATAAVGTVVFEFAAVAVDQHLASPRAVARVGSMLGVVLAALALLKVHRSKGFLYALFIGDLIVAALHGTLAADSQGKASFDVVVGVLALVGLASTRSSGFTRFLHRLPKKDVLPS
jgi:hypothetical protein